jgi:alpha-glucosidase
MVWVWVIGGYAQVPFSAVEVLRVEASAVQTRARITQGSYRFKDHFSSRRVFEGGAIPATEGVCQVERVDSGCLRLRVRVYGARHIRVVLGSRPQEQVFGLGEQFSYVSLKGHRVPVWVEEQGIGRGDQPITAIAQIKHAGGNRYTTFAPIPQCVTTDLRSLQLLNNERSVFDFRDDNMIGVEVFADSLNLLVRTGSSPRELVARWNELPMGDTLPHIPDWALGAIAGLQGGTETMLTKLNQLTEAGSPLSGVWIQDWCGSRKTRYGQQLRWYWAVDSIRYPNIKQVSALLAADSIALLGYINPFLIGEGQLFEEALANNLLLTDTTQRPMRLPVSGFEAYILDLYKPQTRRWVAQIIEKNMLSNGFAGWMADFGEWAPTEHLPQYAHNMNPYYWALTNRMAIDSFGNRTYHAFFSRSAYRGATTLPNFYWAGDQMPNWGKNDGLPSALCAMVSGGWSGMLANHSDIGGFTAVKKGVFRIVRSRQLLKRWIELGTFSPVMRTHESIQPSILQVYTDPDMRTFFARFAQIRKLLFPYLRQCADQATTERKPMVRHLWYAYPNDPNTPFIHNQYLLGADILVAPVVHKNQKTKQVYIPEGTWEHLFSGTTYTQGWHTIAVPIGSPAVFIHTQSHFYQSANYTVLRTRIQTP